MPFPVINLKKDSVWNITINPNTLPKSTKDINYLVYIGLFNNLTIKLLEGILSRKDIFIILTFKDYLAIEKLFGIQNNIDMFMPKGFDALLKINNQPFLNVIKFGIESGQIASAIELNIDSDKLLLTGINDVCYDFYSKEKRRDFNEFSKVLIAETHSLCNIKSKAKKDHLEFLPNFICDCQLLDGSKESITNLCNAPDRTIAVQQNVIISNDTNTPEKLTEAVYYNKIQISYRNV